MNDVIINKLNALERRVNDLLTREVPYTVDTTGATTFSKSVHVQGDTSISGAVTVTGDLHLTQGIEAYSLIRLRSTANPGYEDKTLDFYFDGTACYIYTGDTSNNYVSAPIIFGSAGNVTFFRETKETTQAAIMDIGGTLYVDHVVRSKELFRAEDSGNTSVGVTGMGLEMGYNAGLNGGFIQTYDRSAGTAYGTANLLLFPGGSVTIQKYSTSISAGGLDAAGKINSDNGFYVAGNKVVGARGSVIANTGTTTAAHTTTINAILAMMRTHGMIAT